jgi:NAD(P)-dependent dehydrogenase (short-subunit alcohol dehydrogenase family)
LDVKKYLALMVKMVENHKRAGMIGKRNVVTGAGTGICRGVALEIARAGADVVLHYSANAEGVESAVRTITGLGRRAKAVGGDFRKIEAVEETARLACEFLGGIDVLVNNCGITANVPFEAGDGRHFRQAISGQRTGPIFPYAVDRAGDGWAGQGV